MARRTVAEELRRVLAKLGGTPSTREVAPPSAGTHAPGLCVAHAEPLGLGIAAAAGRVPEPAAVTRGGSVEVPATEGRGLATLMEPGPARGAAVRADAPVVREGSLAAVLRVHRGGATFPPVAVSPVAPCAAAARAAHAPLGGAVPGRVAPLPPLTALGARPRPDGPLLLAHRTRVDWGLIDRERLARDWGRVLRDHRLPAADLQLVGVFGPIALAAVASVAVGADGRLAVRLVRPRLPGPAGDVVIARHERTGALLRSDVS
ncbi:MAG: hypothetical protein IT200_17660 [Thermoleophilia bacterium]|nr:hypothetical protein [Thermoleophilia bacterium]